MTEAWHTVVGPVGALSVDVTSVVRDRTRGQVEESRQLKGQIIDTRATFSVEEGRMIEMLRVYLGGTVQHRKK